MMNYQGYSQNDSIKVSKNDAREAIRQSVEREYQLLEINIGWLDFFFGIDFLDVLK